LDAVVGLVVFFVLAQFIDGRIALFIGLGVAFAINVWKHGQRSTADYAAIPFAVAFAIGTFFLLVGINGWIALAVGAFVALSAHNSYNAYRRSRRAYLEKQFGLRRPDESAIERPETK
jgi:hypothetical protein